MNPEQAGKWLFELLTSVPDGDVTVSVSRSSLLPACTIRIQKKHFGAFRVEDPEYFTSDDFASALDKADRL